MASMKAIVGAAARVFGSSIWPLRYYRTPHYFSKTMNERLDGTWQQLETEGVLGGEWRTRRDASLTSSPCPSASFPPLKSFAHSFSLNIVSVPHLNQVFSHHGNPGNPRLQSSTARSGMSCFVCSLVPFLSTLCFCFCSVLWHNC